jgi:hypothetical protein
MILGVIGIGALRAAYCLLKALIERFEKGGSLQLAHIHVSEALSAILSVIVNSALFVAYSYVCAILFDRSY